MVDRGGIYRYFGKCNIRLNEISRVSLLSRKKTKKKKKEEYWESYTRERQIKIQ